MILIGLFAVEARATCEGPLTFATLLAKSTLVNARGKVPLRSVETFWAEAWPVLTAAAAARGISVADYYQDHAELLLVNYGEFRSPATIEGYRKSLDGARSAIRKIEAFPPEKKLKAAHWQLIRFAHDGVYLLARHASMLEPTRLQFPSFDPFADLTRAQAMALVDSIELSTLDSVIAVHQTARETEARKHRPPNAALPEAIAEEDTSMLELPAATEEEAATAGDEFDLRTWLQSKRTLEANRSYHVFNGFNQKLALILRPEFMKDYALEPDVAHRLIRSIITGRGRTGLKVLFSRGPKIIELRHELHGHKRIFGCLDGRTIHLRTLISIKDNGGTYSRRIPSDFCRDI